MVSLSTLLSDVDAETAVVAPVVRVH